MFAKRWFSPPGAASRVKLCANGRFRFGSTKKHLVIAVMSETWKKHLQQLSGQMIFKINSVLGSAIVTFIEFRVDEKTVADERAQDRKMTVSEAKLQENALNEVTAKMRRSADAIKDDHLRYQFLLAAGSCLARKKNIKEKGRTVENGK
jgi:hypothetical protein